MTIADAISLSGGLTPDAFKSGVNVSRDGRVYAIDLRALYDFADSSQNLLLKHGDIVNVLDRSQQRVFMTGEVTRPGAVEIINGTLNLSAALGEVGGVNQNVGQSGAIYIIRNSSRPRTRRSSTSTPNSRPACCWPSAFRCRPRTSCSSIRPVSRNGTASSVSCCRRSRPRDCEQCRAVVHVDSTAFEPRMSAVVNNGPAFNAAPPDVDEDELDIGDLDRRRRREPLAHRLAVTAVALLMGFSGLYRRADLPGGQPDPGRAESDRRRRADA